MNVVEEVYTVGTGHHCMLRGPANMKLGVAQNHTTSQVRCGNERGNSELLPTTNVTGRYEIGISDHFGDGCLIPLYSIYCTKLKTDRVPMESR